MATILRRTYKVTTTSGKVIEKHCRHYTIQYRDGGGKLRRVKGYTDKAATEQLAARLEKARAQGAEGLVDTFKAHRGRAIAEHVTDYLADLRAAGRDSMYVYNAQKRLDLILKGCGWDTLFDIEPNAFIRWRDKAKSEKRTGREVERKEMSATTLNQYLDTARAFTNWCAQNNRMPGVPVSGGKMMATALASVSKVDGLKVRNRRALSDDEVTSLLAVAPADRKLAYRMGLATGLRRDELDQLKWGDCRISATKPYLALRAEATKARRGDRVPMPQTLAADLRTTKPDDATDDERVFPHGVPSLWWWKKDLESAGIAYKDAMGRQADFHGGTRKTLCTRMHRNGVAPAQAMRIMRHTDIRLTMTDYTDDEQLGTEAAVLPELEAAKPVDRATLTAVGG